MVVKIYCIEDINDLRYVGSTKKKLPQRLSGHRFQSRINEKITSKKLNLYNCIIYVLEETDEEHRIEREKYWIDKIDCVNKLRYDFDQKEYQKEYRKKNKDEIKQKRKEYRQKNKEYQKEYRKKNKEYQKEYQKEYRKKFWFCEMCQCQILLVSKSTHLKTQKHLSQKKQLQDFQECSS